MNAPSAIRPYPIVPVDGIERHFACLPPRADFGGLAKYSAANPIVPRAQWEETDYRSYNVPVLNQGNHGSCVGHGSTTAYWYSYLMEGGTVPQGGFSPTSLYAQINGGRDMGAVVSDAMTALMQTGVGLMADVPESIIYDRQIPQSAKAKYHRFQVSEAYHVETFDEIISALLLGFTVSFGITIGSGFNRPGKDGLIEAGGFPLGGHCMCAYGVKRLADGRWVTVVRNSWGTQFGANGDCLLPEGHFQGRGLDAFAVKAAAADPEDPNKPPKAE